MPEEYKMELPEGVIATITDIPEVVDPAEQNICDSCA